MSEEHGRDRSLFPREAMDAAKEILAFFDDAARCTPNREGEGAILAHLAEIIVRHMLEEGKG